MKARLKWTLYDTGGNNMTLQAPVCTRQQCEEQKLDLYLHMYHATDDEGCGLPVEGEPCRVYLYVSVDEDLGITIRGTRYKTPKIAREREAVRAAQLRAAL